MLDRLHHLQPRPRVIGLSTVSYPLTEALHSCLELVAAMLSNAEVRRTCLAEHENLALINLFTVKRATESDIKRFLPTIWTPFDDAVSRSQTYV